MASRPLQSIPCKNSLQRSRRHSINFHTGLISQVLGLASRRRANADSDCALICPEAYVGGKRTRCRRDSKRIYDLNIRPGSPPVPAVFIALGRNSRSTITHRPGISSLPIRSVQTASPFSPHVEQ